MSTRGEALTPKESLGAAHAPQPELLAQIVSASAAPEVVQLVHASKNIGASSLDVRRIREDFPILKQGIRGKPLVYLGNAASTQKPRMVIDAICHTYLTEYSTIHRGVHLLSELCTKAYEDTRVVLQHFLNAGLSREIIFVRGATEGINLVAQSYGRKHVGAGDEIVISAMEHHSNIVPWQMLCEEKGAHLRVIPMNEEG